MGADSVVDGLVNPDAGMRAVETLPGRGNTQPARYFLSTRLTYRMLVNNIKGTITEPERDAVIAQFAARLASAGPFREMTVVTADPSRDAADVLAIAGIDNAHVNRLVVLGPAQFSLRNGTEQETMDALRKAMDLGPWGGRSCPCSGPAGRSSPWRTPSAAESPWSISRGRRRWPHLRFKVMTTWRQR